MGEVDLPIREPMGLNGSRYLSRTTLTKLTPRNKIRLFFEDPTHSKASMAYQILNIAFMVMSTVTYLIGTDPQFWLTTNQVLFILDCVSTAFFTADYGIRFFVRDIVWWRWMVKFFNICDLLSFLPYYIELIVIFTANSVASVILPLRILRVFRIFRTVKLAKYAKMLPVVGKTFKKSMHALLLLCMGLPIALVVVASSIFFAEQSIQTFNAEELVWYRPDGSVSPFQSVPTAFWFTIVTMTTTGYGDVTPQSPVGKSVTVVAMFIGLIVLTFPLSIFATNFMVALKEYKEEQDKQKIEVLSQVEKMQKNDLYANIRQLLSMREDIREKLDSALELVKIAQEEQKDVDRVLDNLQKYMEQRKLL